MPHPARLGRLLLVVERKGRGAPVNDQTRLRRDDVVSVLEVGERAPDPDFEPIETGVPDQEPVTT
jgi:hypothetical protein